ncbi:protein neprosin-like [Apium graveolens]|uniref:protein neprosin-like n=1 Tax=Apium graveolens TaxID=4045 RepID=UPI003D7A0BC8
MKLLKVLVVLIFLLLAPCKTAARICLKKKLRVQNLLKCLDKPPHKSIKSPDGDIIDCIPISCQPAFDHPLLQNHKIQLVPSYHPDGPFDEQRGNSLKSSEGLKPITQLWRLNGNCDEGTIPVRRTKREDVLRHGSTKIFGKKKKKINVLRSNSTEDQHDLDTQYEHQHATAFVNEDNYFGTQANINVWKPKVQQPNEFSVSQIWIAAGSIGAGDLNTIEAGWMVSQELFGDNNTRLFTFWTRDAYKSTGCYNLRCSAFIHISKYVALGATLIPVSSYNGAQYDIVILIWKDPNDGNWWMRYNNENIGYWPASLFTNLDDGATYIVWGGEVVNVASGGQHTTTQMGSGNFPGEEYKKASYFRNIQVVDGSNQLRDAKDVKTLTEQSSCYDIQTGKNGQWGTYFYYGGPGRNPKCP